MRREIDEQPGVLALNAVRYHDELGRAFAGSSFDLVLLAARGSSDHAALYARYLIETHLRIPVSLAAPSVLTRYHVRVRYPRTLAIGISQSGAAPDVAEVLTVMREEGHRTLAITNTEGSRLTDVAEHSLLLGVGPELSIAATKTYTASLLALYQMVRAIHGGLPEPDLPTESWLVKANAAASEAQGPVVRCQPLFALARGFDYASAHETALKLMECALLSCKAYSRADFEHGPKALAGHGSAAIVYGEPPDLASQGCEVVVAPRADVAPELRPLWEILFGQALALQAAQARGLDPDSARHLHKVTQTL